MARVILEGGTGRKQPLASGMGLLEGNTSRNTKSTVVLGSTGWQCRFYGQNFEVNNLARSCSVHGLAVPKFRFGVLTSLAFYGVFRLCLGWRLCLGYLGFFVN